MNKTQFSILYRKDFITEFETTLEEAIKKQKEYTDLFNELDKGPFKDKIQDLHKTREKLDKQIEELENLIKESNIFNNLLANPTITENELTTQANKILRNEGSLSIQPSNKNALLATIASQYMNKNSISIFPFFF